ncbi:MAG: MBL fold metallo-hydrolase, partial [Alphaproteobacteria bacterium]|nr:MBL fold metallo-hydrolase [Alphaproteobacteria bacterium]
AGTLKPFGGVQQVLENFYKPPIFPIVWSDFPAQKVYHDFNQGDRIPIHDHLFLETCSLNHPDGATGYRLNCADKSVCYVTDTEHTQGTLDPNILQLIHGTDLFIYDATFDDDRYKKHQGWGHSTWQEACRLAREAQVKQTAIFHHCPTNTDSVMAQHSQDIVTYHPTAFIAQQDATVRIKKLNS